MAISVKPLQPTFGQFWISRLHGFEPVDPNAPLTHPGAVRVNQARVDELTRHDPLQSIFPRYEAVESLPKFDQTYCLSTEMANRYSVDQVPSQYPYLKWAASEVMPVQLKGYKLPKSDIPISLEIRLGEQRVANQSSLHSGASWPQSADIFIYTPFHSLSMDGLTAYSTSVPRSHYTFKIRGINPKGWVKKSERSMQAWGEAILQEANRLVEKATRALPMLERRYNSRKAYF